ncbi:PSD1 and planctomycete cytochrome C domain-containing protein [uncultured Gimesia sp.]|uniref:PSD1 and planctomycete cytochrome C domain-containing protein n=1 Tax=uncultured Gimesia sp. TaxID=1678688 RepID=UPI0030D912D4|tara:strand:+ start:38435 stop:41344 length:2910 start_codon:yes stop_codon:yes gene_type:complete
MNGRLFLACLFSVSFSLSAAQAEDPAKKTDALSFENDVRKILKVHCLHCHGENGETEGSLDLRLKRLMVKGGDSGAAIVPGKSGESELIARIEAKEMPPEGKHMPEEELAILKRWVNQGAHTLRPEPKKIDDDYVFPDELAFWSFQPVKNSPVPKVKQPKLVRQPVDAFLLAKLEAQGLTFTAEASKAALARRAFFDLIGLPPTPAELKQFLDDKSPDAYEKLIDRLLASKHYGERWGRHWLDVAGYADTEGYNNKDMERPWAFRYRDYVIRAFNKDKPYDQFLQEQLAGDEMVKPPYHKLKPEEMEKLVATGFLRMAPDGTGSNPAEKEVAKNQVIIDTVNIVSSSILGMTVACAQCHDHKYDPIPQNDYYRFRAIFEPALDWKSWRTPAARRISIMSDADRKVANEFEAEAKKVLAERTELVNKFIDRTLERELLDVPEDKRDAMRTAYKTTGKKRTKEQVAMLKEYPRINRLSSGSLYLYDRTLHEQSGKATQKAKELAKTLVGKIKQETLQKIPEAERAAAVAAQKTDAKKRTEAQKKIIADYPALLVSTSSLAKFDKAGAAQIQHYKDEAKRLMELKTQKILTEYSDKATAIRSKKPTEEFIRVLTEVPGKIPKTFFFDRGDFEQPKHELLPAGLTVIKSNLEKAVEIPAANKELPTTGRRLAYAKYITSGQHPLTARVFVNRLWLHHFGKGIVASPTDFGKLGIPPTHLELLDWLSQDFVSHGWKIKRLHKMMMTSTAYMQSSQRSDDYDVADPDNLLYGHMPVRRLEAETIRDSIIAVTGRLKTDLYGQPVPVKEDEVGQIVVGVANVDSAGRQKKNIKMDDRQFRRSIYVAVSRSKPLAVLDMFDAPKMEPNCEKRSSSTVAPQSLLMMNSGFMVEHAEYFAERLQKEQAGNQAEQVKLAWMLAFGKEPSAEEVQQSVGFIKSQVPQFKTTAKAAGKTPEQLALATFCQALLSSNGFLYVD